MTGCSEYVDAVLSVLVRKKSEIEAVGEVEGNVIIEAAELPESVVSVEATEVIDSGVPEVAETVEDPKGIATVVSSLVVAKLSVDISSSVAVESIGLKVFDEFRPNSYAVLLNADDAKITTGVYGYSSV